jgi:PAS domain S-box-containing protein
LTAEAKEMQTFSMARLATLGADVEGALARVRVPAYVIDRHGIIRWMNPAAKRLVGDLTGRQLTAALAPEEHRRGREIFTRNLHGPPEGSDNRAVLLNADGERFTVELSAVPLERGGQVMGVFGQVKDVDEEPPVVPHPNLTPRQGEVLSRSPATYISAQRRSATTSVDSCERSAFTRGSKPWPSPTAI